MPMTEAQRLAERKRVDEYMRKKRAAGKVPAAKPKPTASEVAEKRRKAITKKAAPTGFMALLSALGYE